MSSAQIAMLLATINFVCMIYWAMMAWRAYQRERRIAKRITAFQFSDKWKVVSEYDALYVFAPTEEIEITHEQQEIKEGVDE